MFTEKKIRAAITLDIVNMYKEEIGKYLNSLEIIRLLSFLYSINFRKDISEMCREKIQKYFNSINRSETLELLELYDFDTFLSEIVNSELAFSNDNLNSKKTLELLELFSFEHKYVVEAIKRNLLNRRDMIRVLIKTNYNENVIALTRKPISEFFFQIYGGNKLFSILEGYSYNPVLVDMAEKSIRRYFSGCQKKQLDKYTEIQSLKYILDDYI